MITHLKREEHNLKLQRLLLDAGNRPPAMSKKYRKVNERLTLYAQELTSAQSTLEQYLRKVAFNLYEPPLDPQEPREEVAGALAAVSDRVLETGDEAEPWQADLDDGYSLVLSEDGSSSMSE